MNAFMRRTFALLSAVVLTSTLAAEASAAGSSKSSRSWDHTARMERGQTVWIHGVNGAIIAESSDGGPLVVEATLTGKKTDPNEVEIRVVPDSDGLSFCAIYPGRASVCDGEHYEMSVRDNDVSVEFRVRVPSGVRLVATTINGGIKARGLDAPIRAATVNGGCEISTRSSGEARSVNGNVTATLGRLSTSDDLDFATVNGSVTVHILGPFDAEVSASTVHGALRSDFPVEMHGRWGPQSMKGTVGRGGARLQMKTVNGSIALRRGETL